MFRKQTYVTTEEMANKVNGIFCVKINKWMCMWSDAKEILKWDEMQ